MHKFFIFILLFTFTLWAREELLAAKACSAFNNMKHSKNTHNITLDTSRKYTVLKHHKGQALILIKGAQPAQRWVDDECFSKHAVVENESNVYVRLSESAVKTDLSKETKKYLLALSWHNAFCETHRYKKECKQPRFPLSHKSYPEKNFVLHGLWPQPKNNIYCNVDSRVLSLDKHKQWHKLPDLNLSAEVRKELSLVMPGFASHLHKHQWVKHGTCYGTDTNTYFEDSIALVKQLNDSKVGKFFRKNIGKRVTLQQMRTLFNRSFGVGTGNRVVLKCKNGLIGELWLYLGGESNDLATLLKKGTPTRSPCQGGIIDRAGFGR